MVLLGLLHLVATANPFPLLNTAKALSPASNRNAARFNLRLLLYQLHLLLLPLPPVPRPM